MDAKEFAGFRKGRVFGKYRFEPSDPVGSFARFAVRKPFEPTAKRRADLAKTSDAFTIGTLPTR